MYTIMALDIKDGEIAREHTLAMCSSIEYAQSNIDRYIPRFFLPEGYKYAVVSKKEWRPDDDAKVQNWFSIDPVAKKAVACETPKGMEEYTPSNCTKIF